MADKKNEERETKPEIKMVPFTVMLTQEEMDKLNALAAHRSTSKVTYTPEKCVREFIQACQPGGSGWVNPTEAAAKYEAGKRAKQSASNK